MFIDFESMETVSAPNFKNGEGIFEFRKFDDGMNRILLAHLKPESSIGHHVHDTNSEVMIFVSGTGRIVCDGAEETVGAGSVHYCPKGSSHEIINTGKDDLIVYCVVSEQ